MPHSIQVMFDELTEKSAFIGESSMSIWIGGKCINASREEKKFIAEAELKLVKRKDNELKGKVKEYG